MAVIAHAPVWVWVLLVILVLRGIKALQPRTMSLGRLLLLPVIFLVWGGYALAVETSMSGAALGAGVIGLLLGGVIGWCCWRYSPALVAANEPGCVIRAGSVLPLIFIVAAFVSRFAMAASLHLHHEWLADTRAMLIVGLWSGAIDGVFWGGSFNLLWRYHQQFKLQSA